MSLPHTIGRALEAIDALTPRERATGFVVTLALVVYGWHALLYAPLDARRAALETRTETLRGELASRQTQTDALAPARNADPDASARARLATLRGEADAIRAALGGVLDHLVPPREMAKVLEAVLTRETGLRLVSLKSLGADAVATTEPEASDEAGEAEVEREERPAPALGEDAPITLYRHGLEVRFTGGYLEALAYLRALEALSWRFMWDSVALEVTEHPETEVTITVFSMSLDEQWMGV